MTKDTHFEGAGIISDPNTLMASGKISEEECSGILEVTKTYKMGISRYYESLIDWDNPACPIRRQCVPSTEELNNPASMSDDPLSEKRHSPVPGLAHKYPDRAALFVSSVCFTYCRHCTRKNTVIANCGAEISESDFCGALDYIKNQPRIRDVLITGGDPLAIREESLEHYLNELRRVPHVRTLRIGTRAIVTHPARITPALADMLKKFHPVWVNTQFNHPRELTKQAEAAIDILLSRGIPVGNQSVLLKGINDSTEVMEELLLKLISHRVRPYYLYQADSVRGTGHFITSYKEGMRIISELRHNISGYAIPRFVIDVPGEHGVKVVAEKSAVVSESAGQAVLQGMNGCQITYTEVQ